MLGKKKMRKVTLFFVIVTSFATQLEVEAVNYSPGLVEEVEQISNQPPQLQDASTDAADGWEYKYSLFGALGPVLFIVFALLFHRFFIAGRSATEIEDEPDESVES